MENDRIIPVFLPFMGCSRKCIYCSQEVITSTVSNSFDIQLIQAEKNSNNSTEPFKLGFYGGTFLDIEDKYFQRILLFLNKIALLEKCSGIRFSTTPESIITRYDRIRTLNRYRIDLVELGIQTFNFKLLERIGRSTTELQFQTGMEKLKSAGISWAFQIMPGLPYECFEGFFERCSEYFQNFKPEYIRIYPLLVFRNTGLEKLYTEGEYEPLEIDECILQVKRLYFLAMDMGIKILKIGLHPEKSVYENCVAGPLTGHLKELVEGSIIVDWILENVTDETAVIEITISDRKRSLLSGENCYVMSRISARGIDFTINSRKMKKFKFIALKNISRDDNIIFERTGRWTDVCQISKNSLKSLVQGSL